MAVVLAFRIAIVLTPIATRYVQTHTAFGAPQGLALSKYLWERLIDPDEDDEDLSVALSDAVGYTVNVATYSSPFELRKVQVSFTDADASIGTDDVRVFTMHCVKLAAGVPTDAWVAADFTAVSNAFAAYWTSIKPLFTNKMTYQSLKLYKAGPQIAVSGPPVYSLNPMVVGTSTDSQCPPQVAISVTEIAGGFGHWGRFFLPNVAISNVNAYGRIAVAAQTTIADATDTLYEALRTAGLPVVVYRPPLPERTTKAGDTLAARSGSAWTVETIQVDDIFDVIRSRRWKHPQLRLQRAIG